MTNPAVERATQSTEHPPGGGGITPRDTSAATGGLLNDPEARRRFLANMVALFESDAQLAMRIDSLTAIAPLEAEPARDGAWTIKAPHAGGWQYQHSRHRPRDEAKQWTDRLDCDEKYVIALNGFGAGHHVAAALERLPVFGMVIVAESDLRMIHAALHAVDFAEAITEGRLLIMADLSRGKLVDRLEPRSALITTGLLFASHAPSVQRDTAFHAEFNRLITEFVAFTRTGFVTLMLNNVATCRNIANNLGRYVSTSPLDTLEGAYRGKPAILVAAGPSLAKNMHRLHAAKGKAVIIAVQTMLKPLLGAGIVPDFVTSLDYNTVSTRFFENLEDVGGAAGVHLVAEPKANWNVLDVFDGKMSLLGNEFAEKMLGNDGPPKAKLRAGATVAHLSFYLAEYLGCDPIVLTGQDLGFVDGLYYKPGVAIHETWGPELGRFNSLETKEWERIVRSRPILRKIPDVHGHPMYTEEQFFTYLQQFERDFAACRSTVIDATEGGARKEHVTLMPLIDVIDRYCTTDLSTIHRPWRTWTIDVPTALHHAKAAVLKRRKAVDDLRATCQAVLPLLQEMLTCQDNPQRMGDLFIQIDRLRSKVGADTATFEMVTHLNTIGEVRKFQHELAVKAAPKDSLERQKLQLVRDIDYVKNLELGCDRFEHILSDALLRLDEQAAASTHGEPWPRHSAGTAEKTPRRATP